MGVKTKLQKRKVGVMWVFEDGCVKWMYNGHIQWLCLNNKDVFVHNIHSRTWHISLSKKRRVHI